MIPWVWILSGYRQILDAAWVILTWANLRHLGGWRVCFVGVGRSRGGRLQVSKVCRHPHRSCSTARLVQEPWALPLLSAYLTRQLAALKYGGLYHHWHTLFETERLRNCETRFHFLIVGQLRTRFWSCLLGAEYVIFQGDSLHLPDCALLWWKWCWVEKTENVHVSKKRFSPKYKHGYRLTRSSFLKLPGYHRD